MELYEVTITYEIPPPAVTPKYLPPTEVLAPPVEDLELPFSFPMFDMETDPELEAAMLNLSQYYLEPLEELPILTTEEILAQEREYLERTETIAERNHKKWLKEFYGLIPP
ncbi:hypothetical protein RHGRI_029493 [Rhododendron griersonianum]|nr:hypothetical protein RHGRI_029493 [Rhododendron griersonianum]